MNASINTFMSSQAETDREFLKQMFEKPSEGDSVTEIVLKVRQAEDDYFTEMDLKPSDLKFSKLTDLLNEEFELDRDALLFITKLPNILVRNDKDVKRFKTDIEIEFSLVES